MPPPHPKGIQLNGRSVRLEPLSVEKHAKELFQANPIDAEGKNWEYLPYGPFETLESYQIWLSEEVQKEEPTFFTIVRLSDERALGIASFLWISQTDGSIEAGHINYSPLLQKTREGTEAMYLMMRWAFDSSYRHYEWKCNTLNQNSRYATQRLVLSYESVFRQMAVNKGRNRNTAWFAAIDKEWDFLNECFAKYLSNENFVTNAKPAVSLSELTKPILYKLGNNEFI